MFEFDAFANGTETIARAIARSDAFSIAGGGDTLAAIAKYGIEKDVGYISTGGGAFLEVLEGKTLPAFEILSAGRPADAAQICRGEAATRPYALDNRGSSNKQETRMARATKIVATLGPASSSPEVLGSMIRAGVDVVRLNFSHGTAQDHIDRAALVREVAQKAGKEVAIMADLQGPKIRVGKFEGRQDDARGRRRSSSSTPRPRHSAPTSASASTTRNCRAT